MSNTYTLIKRNIKDDTGGNIFEKNFSKKGFKC